MAADWRSPSSRPNRSMSEKNKLRRTSICTLIHDSSRAIAERERLPSPAGPKDSLAGAFAGVMGAVPVG